MCDKEKSVECYNRGMRLIFGVQVVSEEQFQGRRGDGVERKIFQNLGFEQNIENGKVLELFLCSG